MAASVLQILAVVSTTIVCCFALDNQTVVPPVVPPVVSAVVPAIASTQGPRKEASKVGICDVGTFAALCNEECHCLNDVACDADGVCPNGGECQPNYGGATCSDCANNYFDANCSAICHCFNESSSACDVVTGECDGGCATGYNGTSCQEITGFPSLKLVDIPEFNAGQMAVVLCAASGAPQPNITVTSLSGLDLVDRNDVPRMSASGIVESNFIFGPVFTSGFYEFNCLVENSFGNVNATFNVTVIDPPVLTAIPLNNNTAQSVTSDSVHLVWKQWQYGVDFGGSDGDQVDYLVEHRITGEPEWSNTSNWHPSNSLTVDNLSPDTVYDFAVRCRRPGVGGEGRRGPVVQFVTKCGLPNGSGIPQNLTVTVIKSDSMLLSWQPPTHANLKCELSKYVLRYSFVAEGGDTKMEKVEISGSYVNHTLENLIPKTFYEISLTAVTDGPRALSYAFIVANTSKSVPGAVVNVTYTFLLGDPRGVFVSWKKPADDINEYILNAELLKAGNCDQIPNDINVTIHTIKTINTEVNLTNLRPFSRYSIAIQSVSDSGFSLSANITAETPKAEPDVEPSNLRVSDMDSGQTYLTIQWDPIPCHEMSDDTVMYQYSVRQLLLRKRRSHPHDFIFTGNVSGNFVTLTGLNPSTPYVIVVQGMTTFGEGPAAKIIHWTTTTLLPPTLKMSILNSTSVLYTIVYATGGVPTDPSLTHELRIKVRNGTHSSVMKYLSMAANTTEYVDTDAWFTGAIIEARVRAGGGYGWSAFSEEVTMSSTVHPTLEAPIMFTIKHLNSSMVSVQWRPLRVGNTVIHKYKIQCVAIDANSSSEPVWNTVEAEHDFETSDNVTTKVNLNNLQTGSAYCVRVAAVSVFGETGFWADKTFFMEDDSGSRRMSFLVTPQPPPPIIVDDPTLKLDATLIHISPVEDFYLYSQLMYYEVVVAMPDVIDDLNNTKCGEYSAVMERRADCWVAARIRAGIIESEEYNGYDFIVGDAKTYEGFFNGPLLINQKYVIMLRTVDSKLESYSPLSSATVRPVNGFYGPYSQAGGPAGICFVWKIPCVWFFVMVIVIVILLWVIIACCMLCNISNHKKIKISRDKTNNMGISTTYRASYFDATAIEMTPLNGSSTARMETFKKSNFFGPIKIRDLAEYVHLRNTHPTNNFEEEFKRIVRGQSYTWIEAKRPENIKKNRYGNILPYDQTRVRLDSIPGISNSDYINASYVDGFDKPKSYIVTQGPKENTFHDFWRMVWQERVPIVVMLTALVENKKKKCDQYWPNLSRLYGDILVHLMSTDYRADVVVRHFELKIVATSDVRRVTHYHYAEWPDLSVPSNVTTVLNLRHAVSDELPFNAGPIVVHCSGGAGRSGAFIAIDAMLKQAFDEDHVHIHNFVNKIRTQRTNLVQTLDQYKFVYEALVEAVQSGNTKVSCGGFADYFQNVCRKSTSGDTPLIEEQFETLNNFSQRRNCFPSGEALTADNACKNRDPTVLPIEHSRVKLKSAASDAVPYINAVQCDGFQQKGELLATQMPLDCTIEDFWTMIYQFKSTVVVMLNDCEFIDENTVPGQYWPNTGCTQYGDYLVEVVAFEEKGMVNLRTLRVTNSADDNEPHIVIQLQFLDWTPDESVPSSICSLVTIVNMADVLKSKYGGPITVHCTDGASRSGIFCVARTLKEQVSIKGEVDVFQTVKRMRQHRPQFITSLEQYRYCYEVALELMSSFGLNSSV